jgi:hypothetical protein
MNAPMRTVTVSTLALCLTAGPLQAGETDGATPPVEHLLQFRGTVSVGADGTGALAALFATSADGAAVRYVLAIENGCSAETAAPCPPPVQRITVRLNEEVVFEDATEPGRERLMVALNPVGGEENRILVTAAGVPGAAARVSVVAVRPLPVVVGGRSVLPLASTSGDTVSLLIVHNAGPEDVRFRLEIFNADGSAAGLSPVRTLAGHATITIDVGAAAAALGTGWVRGPVHVRWAARGFARLSTVAREFRRVMDPSGAPTLVGGTELALDDYRPVPLGRADAALLGF